MLPKRFKALAQSNVIIVKIIYKFIQMCYLNFELWRHF